MMKTMDDPIELIKNHQKKFEDYADYCTRSANTEYKDLLKHVTLLITILLPLLALFITSTNTSIAQDRLTSLLAFVMFVLLTLTLLIGTSSYFVGQKFWIKERDRALKSIDDLYCLDITKSDFTHSLDELVTGTFTGATSNPIYNYIFLFGIISFFTATILLLVIIYRILLL